MRSLHIKRNETAFSVPAVFVDKFMPEAGDKDIKVYLYLLCHLNDGNVSFDAVSKAIGVAEEDITRSLEYWNGKGVIRFSDDEKSGSVEFLNLYDSMNESESFQEEKTEYRVTHPPKYFVKDINAALKENEDVRDMFLLAEQLMGSTLAHNDMKILYSFYDWLKFPVDVILLLLEHCTSIKKADFRYIEKVALTWADNGIDTFEKANIYIKGQTKLSRTRKKVKRILQISDRDFTETELKYVNKWLEELKYTESNIKEAYEITVMNTGKMNFKYMDAVLKNLGKHSDEVKPKQPKKKTNFDNFTGNENISEFEKMMINRRMNEVK